MQQLASYLEKYNRYRHVVDQLDNADPESIGYSIAGDLSEIYDDLNKHLDNRQNGNPTRRIEAFSQWRRHRDIHWGDHALNAMRAVHSYIYDYIRDTDAEELKTRRI